MENRNRVYALLATESAVAALTPHAVALYNALGAFTEVYDSALRDGRFSASDLERPELRVYRQAQAALDAAYAAIRPQDGGTAPESAETGPSRSPPLPGAEVSPDLDAFAEGDPGLDYPRPGAGLYAEETETLPPTSGVGSTEEERIPSQG